MQYTIIHGSSAETLVAAVTQAMAVGWQCQGGVAVGQASGDGRHFYQAVIRTEELAERYELLPALEEGSTLAPIAPRIRPVRR
jgi:hypothetical protein